MESETFCKCYCYSSRMDHLNGFIILAQLRDSSNKYTNPPFKFCPWCGGKLVNRTPDNSFTVKK